MWKRLQTMIVKILTIACITVASVGATIGLINIIKYLNHKRTIKYKCGHTTNGAIILDDNILSMSVYLEWAKEENNLETKEECFDCYLKRIHNSKEKKNGNK